MSTCDRGADVPSYVLGALAGDERASFERHLATCSACRREVADLQVVADSLPLAAEQVAPPRELKDRIMTVVRAEAQAREAEESAPRRPARSGHEPWWRRITLRLAPLRAAVAAVLLLAIGAGGAVLLSRSSTTEVPAQARFASAPAAQASLEVRDGRARLKVSDMPGPPAGKVYEVWLKPPGGAPAPTDALFSPTRQGSASVDVPGKVSSGDQVLVTAEPAGGSAAPTSPPVIVSNPV